MNASLPVPSSMVVTRPVDPYYAVRFLLCLCLYMAVSACESNASMVIGGFRVNMNNPQAERQGYDH